MAFKRRVSQRFRSENNTGFGTNSSYSAGRFFNRNTGRANVQTRGINILTRHSWYHTMLQMSGTKFLLLLLIIYILINIVFAGIYYIVGIEHLAGVNTGSHLKNFTEVFFFSSQTFTTVGYGRISPTGFITSAVATFEAFLGLLSFAIATGLFYGRFSRPQAFVKFSHNALIAPYQGGTALMMRLASYKNNNLSEAEAKLTVAMKVEEDGRMVNRFYGLDLEIAKVNALALSWTLVHPINDKSPLYNFSMQDMADANIEIFVFMKAFDEIFSNTVVSRTSYIASEIVWGARFKIIYGSSPDKTTTIMNIDQLNDFEMVELPQEVYS
jgi:inward rectifier potassium channel